MSVFCKAGKKAARKGAKKGSNKKSTTVPTTGGGSSGGDAAAASTTSPAVAPEEELKVPYGDASGAALLLKVWAVQARPRLESKRPVFSKFSTTE